MNMPLVSDKLHIAQRFSKAAVNYDKHAELQRKVSQALMQWANLDKLLDQVALDIGCGTGELYSEHGSKFTHWINLDISSGMLKSARARFSDDRCSTEADAPYQTRYLCADAEALPLTHEAIDFICSSMALQWCRSPQTVLSEIYRVLSHSGRATLAIMVSPSFGALQQAWQAIGLPSRVNTFAPSNDWLAAAKQFNWRVRAQQQIFYTEHSGVVDMLKSIKSVGANVKLNSHPTVALSKGEISQLQSCFNKSNPMALDYGVLFIDLQKTLGKSDI
jgi:malonyl-CoA O-methyltransferase